MTAFFRRQGGRLLLACLLSFLSLAICTKSSFLYPLNDWVDVQCFFTVGRGILHGLTPYRDLYEQKGPLIYFLYALATGISEGSFVGVFAVEWACFSLFVYVSGRIAEVLADLRGAYWLTAALTALLTPFSPAFSHGGSAEELFLPVLALGLWTVLQGMGKNAPLTDGQGVILGLCAGAALWTKYTFCGLFLGLAAAVILWYAFGGFIRRLPRLIGFFLLGAGALSGLILSWFALRGAVPDLWQAYFVNNLTQYTRNIRSGVYDPPLKNLLNNPTWSLPGGAGLLWLLCTVKKRRWQAAAAWLGAVCLFVFTYLNGRRYPYYALVMAVFAPLGLAALCHGAGRLMRGKQKILRAAAVILTAAVTAAAPFLAYHFSGNVYLMKIEKEDTPQFRFARIIRQAEEPTLLNYGFLDGGFYFASGVMPTNPFFCTLNIDLKEMDAALRRSVQAGETEFVVTRQQKLREDGTYRLVDECSMIFEGRSWKYYLYQRNGGA